MWLSTNNKLASGDIKKRIINTIWWIFVAFLSARAIYLLSSRLKENSFPVLEALAASVVELFVSAVFVFVALFVAIAVHEMGHATMGRFLEYRCYEISVLFLKISFKRCRRIRIKWEGSLGHCQIMPARNPSLRRQFFLLIAGPVASVLFCCTLWLFVPWSSSSYIDVALYTIVVFTIYSLLPIFSGELGYTDVAMAISSLLKNDHAIFNLQWSYCMHLDLQGTRPRDIPTDMLNIDPKKLKGIYRMQLLQACMVYCLDAREGLMGDESSISNVAAVVKGNTNYLFTQKNGFYLAYLVAIGEEMTAHSYYKAHHKEFIQADLKSSMYPGGSVYEKACLGKLPDEQYWKKELLKLDSESATMVFLNKFWNEMLFGEQVFANTMIKVD